MSDISGIINNSGLSYSDKMLVISNDGEVLNPEVNRFAVVKNITDLDKNELKKYFWKVIDYDKDNITKTVDKELNAGYYIEMEEGKSGDVETCLLTTISGFEQNVHNVIVAREGSKLNIITGCIADQHLSGNVHNGVSEIYVGKNAEVTFTMVHSWNEKSIVNPRTAVKVGEGGKFISNYIILDPVKKVQSSPCVYLTGKNGIATLKTFIYSYKSTHIDIGGIIYLNKEGCKGEISTSAVMNGGFVDSKGTLVGNAQDIKAHLSCDAIMLSGNSKMVTTPKLVANKPDLEMTHEASIGKISGEQIEYLQTKGFSKQESEGMIVRGFVDKSIGKLSNALRGKIAGIVNSANDGF